MEKAKIPTIQVLRDRGYENTIRQTKLLLWRMCGRMINFPDEECRVLLLPSSKADIFAEIGISQELLTLSSYSIDALKIEGPRRTLSSLLFTVIIGLGFAPSILHHLGRGWGSVFAYNTIRI